MIPDQSDPTTPRAVDTFDGDKFDDKFDDERYPAYTMGRAADMLGTTQGSCAALTRTG